LILREIGCVTWRIENSQYGSTDEEERDRIGTYLVNRHEDRLDEAVDQICDDERVSLRE